MSIITSMSGSRLAQVRLIDAGFVWTEPHSKRIKLKLTIQKEVIGLARYLPGNAFAVKTWQVR